MKKIKASKESIVNFAIKLLPIFRTYLTNRKNKSYIFSDSDCQKVAILYEAINNYKNPDDLKDLMSKQVNGSLLNTWSALAFETLGFTLYPDNIRNVLNDFYQTIASKRSLDLSVLPKGFSIEKKVTLNNTRKILIFEEDASSVEARRSVARSSYREKRHRTSDPEMATKEALTRAKEIHEEVKELLSIEKPLNTEPSQKEATQRKVLETTQKHSSKTKLSKEL
jgi:hypothetical protein